MAVWGAKALVHTDFQLLRRVTLRVRTALFADGCCAAGQTTQNDWSAPWEVVDSPAGMRHVRFSSRDGENKPASLTMLAFEPDAPTMLLHQRAGDRKAQARACLRMSSPPYRSEEHTSELQSLKH